MVVSALLRPNSAPDQAVETVLRACRLCSSEATFAELSEVLSRPKISSRIDPSRMVELLVSVKAAGRTINPSVRVADCRDPKDDKYLELALAADALAIITGDHDLLELDPWHGIRIVTPAQFLTLTTDLQRRS